MSEQEVTFKDLQQEYAKKAQIFGDLSYRIKCMNIDAETLVKEMMTINQKAAELKNAQEAKTPEVV